MTAQLQVEHIDSRGHLRVPVAVAWFGEGSGIPPREGWEPFWVSINCNGWSDWRGQPEKIVTYKRVHDGT